MWSLLYEVIRVVRFIKAGKEWWLAKAWVGENEELLFNGYPTLTCPPKGPTAGVMRGSFPWEVASIRVPEGSSIGISLLGAQRPFILTLYCARVFIGLLTPSGV